MFLPLIFFGFIKNIIDHFSGENSVQRKSITLKKEEINRINIEKNIVIPNNGYIKNKTINETIKSKMSQNKTKNKQAIRLKSNTNISTNKISKVNKTENIKVIDNMEISIALKIKKKINKLSNEYDIIESEAYLIKKYGNDKNLLERATAIKKEIEVLEEKLSKINKNINNIKENILIEPETINDEDLVESILDYVRADYTDYAIMINGEWGSGKTYFWNNKIRNKIDSLQLNGKQYTTIYMSLYGISNLEEISKKIFIETTQLMDKNMRKYMNATGQQSIPEYAKTGLDMANLFGVTQNGDKVDYSKFFSTDDKVLCFDDLERANVDVIDILRIYK